MTVVRATEAVGRAPEEVPSALSRDDRKRRLFATDIDFLDGWGDLTRLAGAGAVEVAHRTALLLLKPDAAAGRRVERALTWLEERGFAVVAARTVTLGRAGMRTMWRYQLNAGTRDRRDLATHVMGEDPSLLLLVRPAPGDVPATVLLSAAKGPADPGRRRPGELRHVLGGESFLLNFVHAADEPADLARELAILLPDEDRAALLSEVLAGDARDARADAHRLGVLLERHVAAHPLTLDAALAGLREGVRCEAEAAGLHALIDRIAEGASRDWRALWAAADRAGVPPTRWDRVVAGTALMQHTVPGSVPLLASAARTVWTEPGR